MARVEQGNRVVFGSLSWRSALLSVSLGAIAALPLVVGCGDDPAIDGEGGAGGGAGGPEGPGAQGAGASGGGFDVGSKVPGSGKPCQEASDCEAGEFCSVQEICVADGSCAAAADCTDDEVCGAQSKACLKEGACRLEGDCASGTECADGECVIGGACGADEFEAERKAPNVMIVMDRSGSMGNSAGSEGNRWEVAKLAVNALVADYGQQARFGLNTYPSCATLGCDAGTVVVDISDEQMPVQTFLSDKSGCGSSNGQGSDGDGGICYLCDNGKPATTTGLTLASLVGNSELQSAERDNVVLLLTDGAESAACVEDDLDAAAAAKLLLEQGQPVRTYVVGFSKDVDAEALSGVAKAGGTGDFLAANDLDSLKSAFEGIVQSVLSCDFELGKKPPNGDELYVYLENEPKPLERDPKQGWTYDAKTNVVSLHGKLCESLKAGTVKDVDIVFGCPTRDVR